MAVAGRREGKGRRVEKAFFLKKKQRGAHSKKQQAKVGARTKKGKEKVEETGNTVGLNSYCGAWSFSQITEVIHVIGQIRCARQRPHVG